MAPINGDSGARASVDGGVFASLKRWYAGGASEVPGVAEATTEAVWVAYLRRNEQDPFESDGQQESED